MAPNKLMVDGPTRQAYFEAARTIDSDFEMHRVYSAAIKRGSLDPAAVASLLTTSRNIESDFEEASLLVEVANAVTLDATTRAPFFAALATVDSDFEHHRVLTAVAGRQDHGRGNDGGHAEVRRVDQVRLRNRVVPGGRRHASAASKAKFASRSSRLLDSVGLVLRTQPRSSGGGRPARRITGNGRRRPARGRKIDGGFERSNVLLAVARTRSLTARRATPTSTRRTTSGNSSRAKCSPRW